MWREAKGRRGSYTGLPSQVQKVIKGLPFVNYSHYKNNKTILQRWKKMNKKNKIHKPTTLSQSLLTGWLQFNA